MNGARDGYYVIPDYPRGSKEFKAADDAGWCIQLRRVRRWFLCGSDPARAKAQAEALAEKISRLTGFRWAVVEALL